MALRLTGASLGLLLLLPLLLAACNDSAEENSLTIYSGRRETLVGPIIEQYREESGVKVEVKYASSPQLAATLLEEGDDSPADLFFAQEPASLGAVTGLLGPLPDSILRRVPEWSRSTEGRWVGISGRARVVVYNTQELAESDLPDDLWGFVAPEWRGRVGWAPTSSSTQAMVTAMRVLWGEERTGEWLEALAGQQRPSLREQHHGRVGDGGGGGRRGLRQSLLSASASSAATGAGGGGQLPPPDGGPRGAGHGGRSGSAIQRQEPRERPELSGVPSEHRGPGVLCAGGLRVPSRGRRGGCRGAGPLSAIPHPGVPMEELADLEGTQRLMRETGILP